MNIPEIITIVLSVINAFGLTFGGIWLRHESKRLKSAEAAQIETNNAIVAGNAWKDIAMDHKESLRQKSDKIDSLYIELAGWRDNYNDILTRYNERGIDNAKQTPRLCNRPGCPNREPQSGF